MMPPISETRTAVSSKAEAVGVEAGQQSGKRSARDILESLDRWRTRSDQIKFWARLGDNLSLSPFAHELNLLAQLSHENVIKMCGFVEDYEGGKAWVVLPWEAHGNVREFVSAEEWEIPERLSLINDIAQGIQYLHAREPPICHGDLKSPNILVNSMCRAVITDFGSARVLTETSQRRATSHFKPSSSDQNMTSPKDLVEQIITGKIPFQDVRSDSRVVTLVLEGELPCFEDDEHLPRIQSLYLLMENCFSTDPSQRPSAKLCAKDTEDMEYIVPSRSQMIDDDDEGIYSIWLLETLAWSHMKNGRMSESMRCFRRVSKVARTPKEELEKAIVSEAMGMVLFYQNDYTKAAELFAEARDIYVRSGDHGKAAHAIQKIGYVHRDRREYLEAEKSCNEAKSLLIGIGDSQGAGLMECEAAIVLCMKGDYDDAEAILNNAQQTFSRIGSKVGTAHVQVGLGHVHRGRGDFGKAKDLYTKSQAALIRMKHGFCAAFATRGLGHVYRLQGDLDKAEGMYKQVRAIAGEYADSQAWLGLAAIRERQGRNDEAERFLSEASAACYKRGWDEDLPDYDCELLSLYKRIKSAAESDDGA